MRSRRDSKSRDGATIEKSPDRRRSGERRLRCVPRKDRPDLRELQVGHREDVPITPDENRSAGDYPTYFGSTTARSPRRAGGDGRGPEVGTSHGHVLLEHAGDGDRRGQRQARGPDRLSLVGELSDPAVGPKWSKGRRVLGDSHLHRRGRTGPKHVAVPSAFSRPASGDGHDRADAREMVRASRDRPSSSFHADPANLERHHRAWRFAGR